jgi:serine protease Do
MPSMRRFTILTVALASTVAFLVGLILAGQFTPTPVVATAPRLSSPPPGRPLPPVLPAAGGNFADVAEHINASVVNIESAARSARGPQIVPRRPSELPRDFDGPPPGGSGSGFIIDRDGFILTNYHVIEKAERITVTLADGRTFRGEVVGTDPAIDIALLKISGASALPAVHLGNSDELRVGEWVCAIGNPLGYVHSVTVGVVSFVGRKLFDPSLDDYIQTDAAINFGNSGGPLINARGEVIGINSAVSSRTSSIGFAVPINKVIDILPQLKTAGRVSRGYIGVFLTDVTPPLQQALGLSVGRGALVHDFAPDSPAERAGLRIYDVVTDVDGEDVASNDDLIRSISARPPGTLARVQLSRDGRRMIVPVRLVERPLPPSEENGTIPGGSGEAPASVSQRLGLTVRPLDRSRSRGFQIPASVEGVVISRIDPTGAAFSGPMRRDYIIMQVNRRPVPTVEAYERVVSAARPGDVLALYYYDPHNGQRVLATAIVER